MIYILLFYVAVGLNLLLRIKFEEKYWFEVSFSKSLLFGACVNREEYEDGAFNHFQVCFGPLVTTLTYPVD